MNTTTKYNRWLYLFTSLKINECRYFSILNTNYKKVVKYQTSKDLDLRLKQKDFPKLTSQIYMQKEEVKQYDGFSLIDPLLDKTSEPHKLHLIKKIRSVNGEPWWVKNALKKLGFVGSRFNEWKTVHVVKPNSPEVNDLLWLCKHMVRVTPVTMEKSGEPTEADVKYSKLNLENGQLNIIKELQTFIDAEKNKCYKINDVLVSEDKKPTDTFPLDRKEIHRYMHRRKDLCQLNSEYYPTVYEYKFDQDKPGVINVNGLPDTRLSEDE